MDIQAFLARNGPPKVTRITTAAGTVTQLCGYDPLRYLLGFIVTSANPNIYPDDGLTTAPGGAGLNPLRINLLPFSLYGTIVQARWNYQDPAGGSTVWIVEGKLSPNADSEQRRIVGLPPNPPQRGSSIVGRRSVSPGLRQQPKKGGSHP